MADALVWRGSRDELDTLLASVPMMLVGRMPDPTGEVRALYKRLGLLALSIIREAYVVKARGGTDAAGDKWVPLAASTIRRRLRKAGLPTERQARRRLESAYEVLARTGRGQKKLDKAKVTAAKVFGAQVEILRDTGRLMNSLSPVANRNADQIFAIDVGAVTVGTNVEYARYHHEGTRRMPQRRLWPEWEKWPQEWRDLIHAEISSGVRKLIAALVNRGPQRRGRRRV